MEGEYFKQWAGYDVDYAGHQFVKREGGVVTEVVPFRSPKGIELLREMRGITWIERIERKTAAVPSERPGMKPEVIKARNSIIEAINLLQDAKKQLNNIGIPTPGLDINIKNLKISVDNLGQMMYP